ncbi:MAG: MbnP family protein [Chitinophagales bacterium]
MKFYFLLILLSCFLQLKVQAQAKEHSLQFVFTFNGEAIELGKNYYLPSIKDSVQLEALKCYISDVQFLKKGEEVTTSIEKQCLLIDTENPETLKHTFTAESKKKNPFHTIQFNIGIDSLTNVSGALGGDLDPTKGMYWTWQSGYINFKLEGTSNVCPARHHLFQFHIGGYQAPFYALQKVALDIPKNSNIEVHIAIDELLTQINLREDYQIMSPNAKAMEMAELILTIFAVPILTKERE